MHVDFGENRFLFLIIHAINWVVKIKSPFYQGIESASSPGLYSLDVQYFRRTVFPWELGPGGGTVFPKGIRSAGPKIGPDRIPYDTVLGAFGAKLSVRWARGRARVGMHTSDSGCYLQLMSIV